MPYQQQQWADGAQGGTPMVAARLNHMEQGIATAQSLAEQTGTKIGGLGTLPQGGNAGYFLKKRSGNNFDVDWYAVTPDSIGAEPAISRADASVGWIPSLASDGALVLVPNASGITQINGKGPDQSGAVVIPLISLPDVSPPPVITGSIPIWNATASKLTWMVNRYVDAGGDAQAFTVSVTSGVRTLTIPGAAFTVADIGKPYTLFTAGYALTGLIAGVASSTQITIDMTPTVTGAATFVYASALADTALNAALATGVPTTLELAGAYIVSSPLIINSLQAIRAHNVTLYVTHTGNAIVSAALGKAGSVDTRISVIGSLRIVYVNPAQPLVPYGAVNSAGTGPLFATVATGTGTTVTFTGGGTTFPVSTGLDARWPAGSVASPVYFLVNQQLCYYTSITPFASAYTASGANVTLSRRAVITPHARSGCGIALQASYAIVERVVVENPPTDGVLIQGAFGAAADGVRIRDLRVLNPGWAGHEIGYGSPNASVRDAVASAYGRAGFIALSAGYAGDNIRSNGSYVSPWNFSGVVAADGFTLSRVSVGTTIAPIIIDTRNWGQPGASIGGTVNGYSASSADPVGSGAGAYIRADTVTAASVIDLSVSNVVGRRGTGALVKHGGVSTAVVAGVLSTSATPLQVLDGEGFDPAGGSATVNGNIVTYTGVSAGFSTVGTQVTVTIGGSGTLVLATPLATAPNTGDIWTVGGAVTVTIGAGATTTNIPYTGAAWLPGFNSAVFIAQAGALFTRWVLNGAVTSVNSVAYSPGDTIMSTANSAGTVNVVVADSIVRGLGTTSAVKTTDSFTTDFATYLATATNQALTSTLITIDGGRIT